MRLRVVLIVLTLALVLAGCGGDNAETETSELDLIEATPLAENVESEPTPATEIIGDETAIEEEGAGDGEAAGGAMTLPEVDPLATTGDIVAAGSSTVYPLTERMASRFENEGYSGIITIDSIGSGAGLERFCVAGETDIANASRGINESETESCRAIGREPLEFRVGTDALAVVVSSQNDFVEEITMEELAAIFSTAQQWSDVRPEWPAENILRYSPGTDSGTFDYFVEEVFEENEEPILSAANLEMSEDDNVLVQGVQGSPYAVAYFGYAYYIENEDTLRAVNIEGVEPSTENVENGSYPLARPLYIYSSANILQEKPQVADFVNFYLTYVNEEVQDVGYFPASAEALSGARQHYLEALGE